jgi:hypothetical protein
MTLPRWRCTPLAAGLNHASLVGEDRDLDPVPQIEFAQEVGHMSPHRRLANEQALGNLGIGLAAGHQFHNIDLARGQSAQVVGLVARLGTLGELFDDAARD